MSSSAKILLATKDPMSVLVQFNLANMGSSSRLALKLNIVGRSTRVTGFSTISTMTPVGTKPDKETFFDGTSEETLHWGRVTDGKDLLESDIARFEMSLHLLAGDHASTAREPMHFFQWFSSLTQINIWRILADTKVSMLPIKSKFGSQWKKLVFPAAVTQIILISQGGAKWTFCFKFVHTR